MFNVLKFKKAVKSLDRKASTIDEFCDELGLYLEAMEVKLYMDAEKTAIREKIVNIYTFEELSPEMQSKVLDNYRDINVEHDWYDDVTDIWADKLAEMGWGKATVAFSGFGSQGDGASFTATNIDIQKLIKTYGVTDQFSNIYTHDVKADITRSGRYVHENSTSLSLEDYSEGTPESEEELTKLEEFLTEKMVALNQDIYADLEKNYEYLTSDEAIKETILDSEYEFTESGKIEASKKKADYQGWSNRASWAVALWLDNDGFEAPEEMTESHDLADYIKEMVEENNPLADEANMYSDLMQGVIEEVNYREIAENILSSRE